MRLDQAAGALKILETVSYQVVDVADNDTTVHTGKVYFYGLSVNTVLSAHVLPVKDGSTTIVSIPASAAAGSIYLFPGIQCDTSLIVDPDDAATGNITVYYKVD